MAPNPSPTLVSSPQDGSQVFTLWRFDSSNMRVAFSVKNFHFGQVQGSFRSVYGNVFEACADSAESRVDLAIDAISIDTDMAIRDRHLRSRAFLDAVHYPTITFRSVRIEAAAGGQFLVTGMLTIRGITREIVVDALVRERDSHRAHMTATATIDRRDFSVGAHFPAFIVGTEMNIHIDGEATLVEP